VVPISLTVSPAPKFDAPEHIGIAALYRASPLGVVGAMGSGMNYGAIFSMGAVYGNGIGMPVSWIAYFMASIYFGGMLLQWPIGRVSDRLDRRQVIVGVTLAATLAVLAAVFAGQHSRVGLLVLIALFGGTSLPLYSLFIAHTNDHLRNEQMVAASATLVLVGGLGAIMGPTLCASVMSLAGPEGFLWYLVAVNGGLGGFAVYRMTRRASTPLDEQRECAVVAPRASPVAAAIATRTVRDHRDQDLARLIRY
ncbi:MAG: MFS transporter, partial [Gammaproteobacteria bacterium]|nr:MFS transporter [Gammaproteobacteria bacterium]